MLTLTGGKNLAKEEQIAKDLYSCNHYCLLQEVVINEHPV
jgi:hypothetical protein